MPRKLKRHEYLWRYVVLTSKPKPLSWDKAESWVVVGVAEDHNTVEAATGADLKAVSDQQAANALPLEEGSNSHRRKTA